jgi:dimethylamine/trimethylamine dehydrogenase
VVLVTSRQPDESLYRALVGEDERQPAAAAPQLRPGSVQRIGDCLQPGLIATAVYSGHLAARELGGSGAASRRERVLIST